LNKKGQRGIIGNMNWRAFSTAYVCMIGLLIGICSNGLSQDASYVDSMEHVLTETVEDTAKVIILRRLAWYHLRYDTEKAAVYTLQFRKIAQKKQDAFLIATSEHYLGLCARLESRYADALAHFNYALDVYKSDSLYFRNQSGPLFNIGTVYQLIGDYPRALEFYYQDLAIHEKVEYRRGIANTLNSIGITLKNLKEFEEALEIYEKVINICIEEQDDITLSNVLINKAIVLEQQGKYQEAIECAEKSLEIDKKDQYEVGMGYSYEVIARNYQNLGQLNLALENAQMSHALREKIGRKRDVLHSQQALAEIYLARGDAKIAESWADESLTISKDIGLKADIKRNYGLLAEIYEVQGRYEQALEASKSHIAWSDSLYNEEKLQTAKELEVKYEIRQHEQEIHHLKNENEISALSLKRQKKAKRFLLVALGLSLFSIILVTRILNLRLLANKLRGERDRIHNEHQIKEMESRIQVEQMNAVMEGQELERKRIAKDLHDGLGGLLATVKIHFINISNEIKSLSPQPSYQKASRLLDNAVEEVRRIAYNMMPDALTKLGLVPAIEDLAEGLEARGMEVHIQTFDIGNRLSQEKEIMLYRVVQELLNNVRKHAQASKVIIQLSMHDKELHLTVEDNGNGFDPSSIKNGIGMQSIRSRVHFLKGTLQVESEPKKGTTVSITVPEVSSKAVESPESNH
jgi:signal transduction histidine kinase